MIYSIDYQKMCLMKVRMKNNLFPPYKLIMCHVSFFCLLCSVCSWEEKDWQLQLYLMVSTFEKSPTLSGFFSYIVSESWILGAWARSAFHSLISANLPPRTYLRQHFNFLPIFLPGWRNKFLASAAAAEAEKLQRRPRLFGTHRAGKETGEWASVCSE